MQYEFLGSISYPSDIKYVDNGIVYVSSVVDNPLLLQLKSTKTNDPQNPFIEVLTREEHLGSVVDFAPIENRATGVSQLVACSNHICSSSVYVLGKGISVHQLTSCAMPYVADMWGINFGTEHYLAASFVGETRVLKWDKAKSEIAEIKAAGVNKTVRSLLCAKLDEFLVQVTDEGIILTSFTDGFENVVTFYKAANPPILHAAVSSEYITISEWNNTIHVFELQMQSLAEIYTVTAESEISALALSSGLLAFACWDNTLSVYSFAEPDASAATKETTKTKFKVEAEAAVRSMEFCAFESDKSQLYLFCGTADGFLISFELVKGQDPLGTCKYISLGTQFVKLKKLTLGDSQVLVGCSETATLIHYSGGRLQYSPINLEGVSDIATFNLPISQTSAVNTTPSKTGLCSTKDVLLIASKGNLMLGIIDDIQRISSVRIKLAGVQVRKVAYEEKSATIVVLADSETSGALRGQTMIYNAATYTLEDIYQFDPQESVCSLNIIKGIPSSSEVLIVCFNRSE